MREIKFRAWDKKNKVMNRDVLALIDFEGKLWVRIPNTNPKLIEKLNDKPYAIMQYTGLKDKNGKEIYEEDIVEWVTTTRDNGTKGIVSMGNDGGWLINDYYKVYSQQNQIKVIGNIYENLELLKRCKHGKRMD